MLKRSKQARHLQCARDAQRSRDIDNSERKMNQEELEFSQCSFSDYNSESDEIFGPHHGCLMKKQSRSMPLNGF